MTLSLLPKVVALDPISASNILATLRAVRDYVLECGEPGPGRDELVRDVEKQIEAVADGLQLVYLREAIA